MKATKELKDLPCYAAELIARREIGEAVIELAGEEQRAMLARRAAVANAEALVTGYYPADMLGAIDTLAQEVLAPYGCFSEDDTARAICECMEGWE